MAILNDTIIHGDLYLKNSSKILLGADKYKALRYNASNKQIILGDEKGNSEAHTFITGKSVTLNSNKFLITSDKALDIFTSTYITDNIITAVITNKTCFTNDTYFHNPLNSNTKVEVTADKVRVSDMLVSSTTTLLYNNTEISSGQPGNTSKIVNASGKNTISGITNISGTTSISGITNTSGTTNISGTLKINTSDLQSTVKITKLSGALQIDTSNIDNHINYYGNIKFNDYIRMPISEGNNKFTIEKVCKVDINQSGSTNETVIHFGGDSHSSTNDTSSFLAASSIFNVSTVALFASSSYNYNSVISQYKADKEIISKLISNSIDITAAIKTSSDAYKPSLVIDGNNIYMSNYATLPFSDDSTVSPPTIYLGKNTGEDAVTGLYGDIAKTAVHRVNRQVVTIFGRLSGRYKGLYGKADPDSVYNGNNDYNNYATDDTKFAVGTLTNGAADERPTGIPPVGGQIYFQIID